MNPFVETDYQEEVDELNEEILRAIYERGKSLFLDENFEESLLEFEEALRLAIEFYGDECHYKLADYYYGYANTLLAKIESNKDVLGEIIPKVKENKNVLEDFDEFSSKIPSMNEREQNLAEVKEVPEEEEEKENGNEINPTINTNGAKEEDENVDDLQIVWENLEVARTITKKHIDSLTLSDPEKLSLIKFLAKIKTRIGDLQGWREDFNSAKEEYLECINLLNDCDDPMKSRSLSEVNFLLGNVYLFTKEEDVEDKAIHHFNEARKIIENILLEKVEIPIDKTNLFGTDREFIKREYLVVSDKDSLEVADLKQLLVGIYDKIEDTLIEKSQKEILEKEKEKMKNELADSFKPSLSDQSQPVVNLGSFGNATKTIGESVKNLGVYGSASKEQKVNENFENSTAEKEDSESKVPIIKRKPDPLPEGFENGADSKRIKSD